MRFLLVFLSWYCFSDTTLSHSFPVMVVFLREKYVIAIAKQFLERLHRRCTYKYGSPPKALEPENVNVRVVLSAYMIAVQPAQVFDSMGVLEQSLYESAVVLTTDMEHLARDIVRRGAPCLFDSDKAKSFPIVIFEFLKRFKAWKVPDEAKLACRIKHALVALYQAEQQFPPNEPENSKLKLEFRTQIERLRGKLQQIAGVDALTEFDKNYKSGTLPLTLPIGEGYGPGAYASLPGRMSNEHLAHELLMDPLFQLSDTGDGASENPFYHRIRQSFHKVCTFLFSNGWQAESDLFPTRRSGKVWSKTSNSQHPATCAYSVFSARSAMVSSI